MSESREGIVLRTTPYGENQLILNIFTPEGGTTGFIASLAKKGKPGLKKAHFQALQILDLKHAERNKGELKRLQEARIHYSYQNLYFDPVRSCLSLFLAEILYKVLKNEEPSPPLYRFLKSSLILLDQAEGSLANFHLVFLMNLSSHLGFSPQIEESEERLYFDLMRGETSSQMPDHPYFIDQQETRIWAQLSKIDLKDWQKLNLRSTGMRRQILQSLIDFYRLHVQDFGELRSLTILREVLA